VLSKVQWSPWQRGAKSGACPDTRRIARTPTKLELEARRTQPECAHHSFVELAFIQCATPTKKNAIIRYITYAETRSVGWIPRQYYVVHWKHRHKSNSLTSPEALAAEALELCVLNFFLCITWDQSRVVSLHLSVHEYKLYNVH
jgi:hypothetical protein